MRKQKGLNAITHDMCIQTTNMPSICSVGSYDTYYIGWEQQLFNLKLLLKLF